MKALWLLLALAVLPVARAEFNPENPIPELKLTDGRILANVHLVGFGNSAITAKWDGGRGTLLYTDLPPDLLAQISPFRPAASDAKKTAEKTSPIDKLTSRVFGEFPAIDRTPIAPTADAPPAQQQTIAGQCFIATKGGDNIKLGLVEVSVYPKSDFEYYESELAKRTAARFDAMWKFSNRPGFAELPLSEMDKVISVGRLFVAEKHAALAMIPRSSATTTTDADGKFSLTHAIAKPYVVFARASRSAGGDQEYYVWKIPSDDIRNPAQLFLSNNNAR